MTKSLQELKIAIAKTEIECFIANKKVSIFSKILILAIIMTLLWIMFSIFLHINLTFISVGTILIMLGLNRSYSWIDNETQHARKKQAISEILHEPYDGVVQSGRSYNHTKKSIERYYFSLQLDKYFYKNSKTT